MVDFEGGKLGGFDADNGSNESFDAGSNEFQEAPVSYSPGTRFLVPDANGVVVLPEGASLEDVTLQGGDLVITLADGSTFVFPDSVYVLPDGTIFVPQIVAEGVALDPTDVTEFLNPQGPGLPQLPTRSSGGNFEEDPGNIQDAFDLGDLLPYTELSRIVEEEEEVLPNEDSEPEVVIETPDNPVGVVNAIATVLEEGLPARGEEPEGTNEPSAGELTSGTIVFVAQDGVSAIILNGVEISAVGQEFVTDLGTLTITSVDLASGEIGFEYLLQDNTLEPGSVDTFAVTVIDTTGDEADATLSVNIIDDAPIAFDDTANIAGGTFGPVSGNVVDNDVSGADGFPEGGAVTGFSNENGSADPSDTLQGQFGSLTLNADGSFSYSRDFNTPGGVEESFDYDIVDQDGSTSSATLLIVIGDAPAEITFVPQIGEGTEVDEAGLPPRGEEPVGSGEGADNDPNNNSDPSENTGATITFESPDGLGSISIDGTPIDLENLPQTIIVDGGTLVITDVTFDPETGDGTITYDFTLEDNTDGDDTTVEFDIEVTDLDGDTAEDTVVINVLDDVPEATDDSATQSAENAPITVDVFANDIEGADGVELTAIAAVDGTLSGAGDLVYNDDGTFTYTPAAGEEGTVTFDYTITDGDGDVSTATVTIDLLPDSTPEISVEGLDTVDEAGLAARGDEPAGSDEAANSEFATGSIPIDTGNDTVASLVINGVDVTAGGTVPTDKGVLTITLTNGEYSYSYELTDNTLSDPDTDAFELVVTDSDGDTASTDLVINILDDVPTAVDDTDSLDEGGPVSTSGNVITNAEANGDNGADTVGADGAVVQNAGTIAGTYGDLVLNADGSYTYTLTAFGISQLETLSDGESFVEEFDYTLVDGDGDTSDATLTITLNGEDDIVTVNGLDGQAPEVSLDEDDLANANDDQGSDQSDPLFQNGTFGVTSPDGLDDVQVNGVDVVVDGVFTATEVANDGVYSVTVTGWTPTFAADGTTVISATFDYTATLLDNTLEHTGLNDAALVEMLTVTADDVDGSSDDAVLDVEIVDDTPTAVDDTDSLDEGGPVSTSGNVITNAEANGDNGADTVGADGAVVQNAGTIAGTYGDLVLNADGSYTYTLTAFGISQLETLSDGESFVEEFDYTLVDGDGDTSDATLTITLNGEDDIVTVNGLDGQAPEVSLDEDDLANANDDQGSDQSDPLFQNGTFGVTSPDGLDDVQVNGVDVVVDGVFTATEVANDGVYSVTVTGWTPTFAADGTTVISATFDYTATLLDNTLEHTGLNDAALVEMLTVTADDVDGSSDDAVLDVEIVDDTPTAVDDADSVVEGQTADGNVITGVGGTDANNTDGVADISGADGYSDAGPVVSVRTEDGVSLDATPDGAGNYFVTSALGTLTINQDGSYTYASAANSTNADTTDTFIYTIRDGDGDESEAELVIDIANVAGKVSDNGALVFEAGLDGIGSDAASNSETFTTGQITVTDATGPFVYVLNDPAIGNYGTLTLNADGSYSYTLTAPVDGDSITPDQGGDNGNNQVSDQESFDYQVFDLANNLIGSGTIVVTIEDDVPTVELELSSDSVDMLITQDADTDPGPDTAMSDISDAFTVTTETYGADQPGTLEITYEMTLLAAVDGVANATGLFSGADEIFVYKIGETVVGSTSLVAPVDASDPSVVFTIEVASDTGVVTLTQISEITHADNNDTSAPYDDQLAELASGLVGVTATATITDADGDVDSDPETYDLANLVRFADDGPSIEAKADDGAAPVLTTMDELTEGLAFDTDVSTANFSGAFTVVSSDAGADEPGTVDWDFDLRIDDADSGLFSNNNAITLYSIGGVVVGSTAAVVGDVDVANIVFSIAVDGDGVVTLTQFAEIDHADNNDTSAPYNDQFATLADGKVSLLGEATITDADQDEASDPVELDLGGNIRFADDGPSLSEVTAGAAVSVDETDAATPEVFSISATSLASVINFTSDFGADGEKDTEYTISVLDALGDPVASTDSGLQTADGDLAIILEQTSDTVITGTFNGGADEAFVITINPDGTVTLEQKVALEHLVDGDDVVVDHNDILNLAGKIGATVTITDGDDDEASESVEIGSNLTFLDDGPSVELASGFADELSVSDTDLGSDSEDFSDAFEFDAGNDGEASTSYALLVTDGAASGLYDNATDEQVFLFLEGGEVVGRHGTDAVDAQNNGAEVFSVSVDANGEVTLDLSRAIDHTLSGGDGTTTTLASADLIKLEGTVTDKDGDTASEELGIGQSLNFADDTPTAEITATAFLDDDTQGGNPGGPDDQNPDTANTTGSLVDDVEGFGNDGGTVAFSLAGEPAGFQYITNGNGGVFIQQFQDGNFVTVVEVTLNTSTGDYTVTQVANILHADDNNNDENEQNFTLNATLTDGDGDTAPAVLNITVDDDTPIANNGAAITGLVDEDGLPDGIDNDADLNDVPGADLTDGGSVGSLFTAGADAPLTYGLDDSSAAALDALGLTSDGATVTYTITPTSVVAVAGVDPIFTFTLNSDGDWSFTLQGALDHEVAADGENVNDIEIDFGSLIQATDADGDTIDATGTLIVTVDDDTPLAVADTDTADEGGTATGNVLTNDEGGADGLESPAIIGITSTNEATSDDTPAAGEFVLAGEFGTLTLNENGEYSYDVPADTITVGGDDVFTYTIVDNDGDEVTTTLTFTVSPVNLMGNAPSVTVYEEALDTTVDAGDVAAGSVTGSAPSETTESDTGTVVVAGATEFGIQGGTSDGMGTTTLIGSFGTIAIDEATGDFTYTLTAPVETTPNANDGVSTEFGETFTYTAQDDEGNSTTGTITVNVVDDVPTAEDDGIYTVAEDTPLDITDALDNDVYGADGVDETTDIAVTTQATKGTVVYNNDGTFTYTPNAGAEGGDTFVYTVTDGDGDTETATVFLNIDPDSTPNPEFEVAAVDDDGLPGGNPASTTGDIDADQGDTGAGENNEAVFVGSIDVDFGNDTGTVDFSNLDGTSGMVGTEMVNYTWAGTTLTATGPRGILFTVDLQIDGSFTVTLVDNVLHAAGGDEASLLVSLNYRAADSDGDVNTNGALSILFNDDAPTLGTVQSQQTDNDPATAPAVGTLNYAPGADGTGSVTITADVTGLTSGGQSLFVQQIGDVLYGYADDDGIIDGDETEVFKLTVDENAGTSGQYTFDLVTPLDPTITPTPIGQGSSFGVGPSSSVIVTDDASMANLVFVTGYQPIGNGGLFTAQELADWKSGDIPELTQEPNVNGSTQGWGLFNNNFDQGEFLRFDFGDLNDYDGVGPYTLPNPEPEIENVAFATFTFFNFNGSEEITFVVHYTDGSTEEITVLGSDGVNQLTIEDPGKFIDWVDVYQVSGSIKLNLIEVGVQSESIDETIDFSVQFTDADMDPTTTQDFSVRVADGLTPDAPAVSALSSFGGGATTASAFNTMALLDDGTDVSGLGGPDGSGSLISMGTNSFSNDNDLMMQSALRGTGSTQIAAAGFGAMMVNFSEMADGFGDISVTNGAGFQGFGETSYELASFEAIDGGFNSVVEIPELTGDLSLFTSTSLTQFDSVEFIGMNPMAEAGVQGFEFGGSSDFVSDVYSGVMSDAGSALDVGADMEALLALNDDGIAPVDLAQASGLHGNQDIADITVAIEEIVNDIMAEGQIDAMIEHFAGEVTGFTGEMSYLADNALAQSIDGGAFTFGASSVADMTEDAAAMAAVHA